MWHRQMLTQLRLFNCYSSCILFVILRSLFVLQLAISEIQTDTLIDWCLNNEQYNWCVDIRQTVINCCILYFETYCFYSVSYTSVLYTHLTCAVECILLFTVIIDDLHRALIRIVDRPMVTINPVHRQGYTWPFPVIDPSVFYEPTRPWRVLLMTCSASLPMAHGARSGLLRRSQRFHVINNRLAAFL